MIKQKGQSLVELLVVIGLSGLILPSFLTGLISSRSGKAQQLQKDQATIHFKETEEIIRHIKDSDWSKITPLNNSFVHINKSGNDWVLSAGTTAINDFTQGIQFSPVFRDISGSILSIGTSDQIDPSTIKALTTISWNNPISTTLSTTTYLTRYNSNVTQKIDSTIVELEKSGAGDWCKPADTLISVNLQNGTPNAIDISAIEGSIVTGGGGSANGPVFCQTNIIGGTASVTGKFDSRTSNAIFRDNDHYGYIASTDQKEEIKILDLNQFTDSPTNSVFKPVGYFNAPGQGEGTSIYVLNNIGYMTSGNSFYIFNLSDKSGPRPIFNENHNIILAGKGKKIIIRQMNNKIYAFIATDSTQTQLQIIDVTDPINPSIVGNGSTNNSKSGVSLSVNSSGSRTYLITSNASGKNFFIFNTTNPIGNNLFTIGNGYSTNGTTPKGVIMIDDDDSTKKRAIIVGTGGTYQYIVLMLNDEFQPQNCPDNTGLLAVNSDVFGITSLTASDGNVYSYIITHDKDKELKIIKGGDGSNGGIYNKTRTYTSQAIGFTNSVVFNRFSADVNLIPLGTGITFQIGIGNTESGSCNHENYTYINPIITSDPSNKSLIEGSILWGNYNPNYKNPGQCLKYRVFLSTSDTNITPILYDFNINYSP